MSKLQKSIKDEGVVEGYVDRERNVYVITKDTRPDKYEPPERLKNENTELQIKEILKKYRPNFL